jgi:hypothetical protein
MPNDNNTPQSSGHRTRATVADHWRNSVLVGPQTAGLPTVHNEDEWAGDGDRIGSDDKMQPAPGHDLTGGALDYHRSQRK